MARPQDVRRVALLRRLPLGRGRLRFPGALGGRPLKTVWPHPDLR